MYYSKEQLESYSPRLSTLLYQQDRMDSIDRSTPEHEPVLYKIIQVSREEKELFVYMSVMMDAMYFFIHAEAVKAIRCAELFLREGKKLMEDGISTEPHASVIMENYMGVLENIGELYMGFPQISDVKMEHFFDIYREGMRTYGREWRFYHTKLEWAVFSRNQKEATAAYKRFRSLPIDRGMCYICINEPVTRYYIFTDDFDKAMEQCRNFISGTIPKEFLGRYETCAAANSYHQYTKVCVQCMRNENGKLLDRILPILYSEMQDFEDDFQVDCDDAFVFAMYDDFEHYENHVKEAVWEIEEKKRIAPYDYMYACLEWMVYFRRLGRSGVATVDFVTEKSIPLMADDQGRYSVLDLAAYFEQEADEIGEKFDQSRRQFSYGKRKDFFKGQVYHVLF